MVDSLIPRDIQKRIERLSRYAKQADRIGRLIQRIYDKKGDWLSDGQKLKLQSFIHRRADPLIRKMEDEFQEIYNFVVRSADEDSSHPRRQEIFEFLEPMEQFKTAIDEFHRLIMEEYLELERNQDTAKVRRKQEETVSTLERISGIFRKSNPTAKVPNVNYKHSTLIGRLGFTALMCSVLLVAGCDKAGKDKSQNPDNVVKQEQQQIRQQNLQNSVAYFSQNSITIRQNSKDTTVRVQPNIAYEADSIRTYKGMQYILITYNGNKAVTRYSPDTVVIKQKQRIFRIDNNTAFRHSLNLMDFLEGGFSDRENDRGGRTNRGVTHSTYNAYRDKIGKPRRDVKLITQQEVEAIYLDFWRLADCSQIFDGRFKLALHQAAANCGNGNAERFLQRALNRRGFRVTVDGAIGPQTIAAFNNCLSNYWGNELLQDFFAEQQAHYDRLVASDASQQGNENGWRNRISRTATFLARLFH